MYLENALAFLMKPLYFGRLITWFLCYIVNIVFKSIFPNIPKMFHRDLEMILDSQLSSHWPLHPCFRACKLSRIYGRVFLIKSTRIRLLEALFKNKWSSIHLRLFAHLMQYLTQGVPNGANVFACHEVHSQIGISFVLNKLFIPSLRVQVCAISIIAHIDSFASLTVTFCLCR